MIKVHPNYVVCLLATGVYAMQVFQQTNLPGFISAIKNHDFKRVAQYLQANPALANAPIDCGSAFGVLTPLHLAMATN